MFDALSATRFVATLPLLAFALGIGLFAGALRPQRPAGGYPQQVAAGAPGFAAPNPGPPQSPQYGQQPPSQPAPPSDPYGQQWRQP